MNKFLKFVGAFFICVFALTLASCGETKEPTTNEPTQVVPTEKPTPTPTEPTVPTEKPTPTPTEPTIPTENPTPTPEVEEIDYSVVVKDIAGKPLSEFYVTFYLGKDIVAEGFTNSAGTFAKNLEANIYDVLSSIDDFSSFGNCLVRDMICRIISLSCDKYPILKEDNFDYYVNGSDCHLYYNGSSICSIKDIEEIAEDLEENE